MSSLFYHLKALILNIVTRILTFFIHRDNSVWIFGSWMGTRFADNSRFLYQYLSENGDKYGINKVVWITRNKSVLSELKQKGYDVELANSIVGFYYHIKAGVHVVCNMAYTNGKYLGDINGNLSWGAKKIQLWHGFPIKGNVHSSSSKNQITQRSLIYRLSLPGRWQEEQFVAATSKECARRYKMWFSNSQLRTIVSGYPRNCGCLQYSAREKEIIDKVINNEKTILYLPTFRDGKVSFKHPLVDQDYSKWIIDNKILWIEKPHSASSMDAFFAEVTNSVQEQLVRLEGDFDVNVLLPHVSLVITDYSSVSADAIYFNCPVIYYIPDFDEYCANDRGLTDGFDKVTEGQKIFVPSDMLDATKTCFSISRDDMEKKYERVKGVFFDGRHFSYDQQVRDIISSIMR